MKNSYQLLSFTFLLVASHLYSQNDTIYFLKTSKIINKQSIKPADLDSVTFYKPTITVGCGNLTDIDGNVYPTVKIGEQCWMQKNLNVSKYRNGDDIPQVQDPTKWANLTTGAWCYYNNDMANGLIYGKLYNWYAVHDPRGLAPIGYHIPSDSEWTTLITFLGGQPIAGGKLKSTNLWISPNTVATNSSGFSGIPGGYRDYFAGTFGLVGEYCRWWSSTESSIIFAWSRFLYYSNGFAKRDYYNRADGSSVRCLKD